MDEIEQGFSKLIEKLQEKEAKTGELAAEIRNHDAELLRRMAESAIPVIRKVGLNLLEKGKQDPKGELYETTFYSDKVIVLGKTDPLPYRPDDPGKKVLDQFCILTEEGVFQEMMYSSDGYVLDSYRQPLSAEAALNIYGYDVMFMVYRAMKDYLDAEEALIEALGRVIEYIFGKKEKAGQEQRSAGLAKKE